MRQQLALRTVPIRGCPYGSAAVPAGLMEGTNPMKQSRLLFAPPLLAFAALIATPVLSQAFAQNTENPCRIPPDGDQKSLSQTLDDCNGVIKPPKVGDSELVEPAPDVGKSRLIRPGDLPAQQSGADAQPQTGTANPAPGSVVLSNWSYQPLYTSGWSVDQVFDDAVVLGREGEEIGDVENIVFDRDGEVLSLIAEVGGLWEVGDTHVSIPWNDLKFSKDGSRITVPITEDTVDDYSAAAAQPPGALHKKEAGQVATVEEDLATGPQLIKATDIIGDTAFLNNAERYGYISDILVKDGRLAAVVADTRIYGRGYRAFPYAGPAAWASGSGRYELGYGVAEVRKLENFDYSRMLYKGPTEHTAKSSTDNAPGSSTAQ